MNELIHMPGNNTKGIRRQLLTTVSVFVLMVSACDYRNAHAADNDF